MDFRLIEHSSLYVVLISLLVLYILSVVSFHKLDKGRFGLITLVYPIFMVLMFLVGICGICAGLSEGLEIVTDTVQGFKERPFVGKLVRVLLWLLIVIGVAVFIYSGHMLKLASYN